MLTAYEASKKAKYLGLSHEARKSFVPLMALVDGVMVKEHAAATKCLQRSSARSGATTNQQERSAYAYWIYIYFDDFKKLGCTTAS